jgi:phosphomannomutase
VAASARLLAGGEPLRPLKISINGVRGIVGETLTPRLIVDFAHAFSTYIGPGKVLVSRDTRPSGDMVTSCVLAGLIAAGCEVVDLGICPTPALQLMVRDTDAVGGVAVTAGHNDEDWNALKFVRQDGLFLNFYQGEELLDIYHQKEFARAAWDGLRPVRRDSGAIAHHLERIRSALDVEGIRNRRFKVAVDCCNGACSYSTPAFLESLGCEVVAINIEPELGFPHEPEPNALNMSQLRALVKASGADVGFAQDADGDRLGVVPESADQPSEEHSLCLVATHILDNTPGPIVTNLSTTSAIEEIAERRGGSVVRTKVGQAYVAEAARDYGAVVAGEGSGGVAMPCVHIAHDSTAAIGYILEYMAQQEQPLSALIGRIPKRHMRKEKIGCPPQLAFGILQQLRDEVESSAAEGATVDLQDGIRLAWPDAWVHVRASITEPLIRVISESLDPERAEELLAQYAMRVRRLL